LAEVVEKWIPRANIRKDLWGWCDIIAVYGECILAVQSTTYANVAARVEKITESETYPIVRKAIDGVEVHGWRKKDGHWQCRSVVV
jgi:hypothetical protein